MRTEEEKRGVESKLRRYAKDMNRRAFNNENEAGNLLGEHSAVLLAYAEIQKIIADDLFKILGDK